MLNGACRWPKLRPHRSKRAGICTLRVWALVPMARFGGQFLAFAASTMIALLILLLA
jgi:hypothetical protein